MVVKEVVAVLIGLVIRSNYSSPGSRIGASGSSSVSNMNGRSYSKRGINSKRRSSGSGSKTSACNCTVSNICGGSRSSSH